MKEKKMTRAEKRTATGQNTGCIHDTVERTDCQGKIAALLSRGQENAVPLAHLEALTGLDGRRVREQIERERRSGVPILSQDGYYLPADDRETERFVKSMRRRANEILKTAKAVERGRGD